MKKREDNKNEETDVFMEKRVLAFNISVRGPRVLHVPFGVFCTFPSANLL